MMSVTGWNSPTCAEACVARRPRIAAVTQDETLIMIASLFGGQWTEDGGRKKETGRAQGQWTRPSSVVCLLPAGKNRPKARARDKRTRHQRQTRSSAHSDGIDAPP